MLVLVILQGGFSNFATGNTLIAMADSKYYKHGKGGVMRLTKLQCEFIDKDVPKGSFVAFPKSVFKSDEYKAWRRLRRAKKRNLSHNN